MAVPSVASVSTSQADSHRGFWLSCLTGFAALAKGIGRLVSGQMKVTLYRKRINFKYSSIFPALIPTPLWRNFDTESRGFVH
jgi:hypothetical protein